MQLQIQTNDYTCLSLSWYPFLVVLQGAKIHKRKPVAPFWRGPAATGRAHSQFLALSNFLALVATSSALFLGPIQGREHMDPHVSTQNGIPEVSWWFNFDPVKSRYTKWTPGKWSYIEVLWTQTMGSMEHLRFFWWFSFDPWVPPATNLEEAMRKRLGFLASWNASSASLAGSSLGFPMYHPKRT